MIPSIDTYLADELESKLKIILSNRYIIEEILKGIQPDVAENFIDTYFGSTGREIPIVYEMPQEKVTQRGAIYIGLREGTESDPSIGNLEDTYEFKEDGQRKDLATIESEDNERVFLEVSKDIGELINVENLAFSASDNVQVEGNRIYFKYDSELLGMEFNVNYIPTAASKEETGLKKGFTATEHYTVLVISTNMDVVRCLDQIVKAILIMLRDNPEEKANLILQRLQFGQIEEVDTGRQSSDSKAPEILYGRETIVTYKVSYSLDVPLMNKLNEIIVNLKPE